MSTVSRYCRTRSSELRDPTTEHAQLERRNRGWNTQLEGRVRLPAQCNHHTMLFCGNPRECIPEPASATHNIRCDTPMRTSDYNANRTVIGSLGAELGANLTEKPISCDSVRNSHEAMEPASLISSVSTNVPEHTHGSQVNGTRLRVKFATFGRDRGFLHAVTGIELDNAACTRGESRVSRNTTRKAQVAQLHYPLDKTCTLHRTTEAVCPRRCSLSAQSASRYDTTPLSDESLRLSIEFAF